ncbi:MAG TPA: 30S ribosomal protein S20 [Clostridia bacterium]|nr:30S ribosomal protein S20 [Clostridia bacterium]
MSKSKSAIKRTRLSRERNLRNSRVKSVIRTATKRVYEDIDGGDREQAQVILRDAISTIDRAVTKGVLHKNTAARKKSRLTKHFNKKTG